MQIHRVKGSSLKDALLRARRAHGEEAIVLQHEIVPGGDVALAVVRAAAKPERRPEGAGVQDGGHARTSTQVGLTEVARHMARNGASPEFIDLVCARTREQLALGVHALDVAADVIGEMFPPVRSPKLPGATRVIAFVGAPGSGKTQTMLKLAACMTKAGRRVELAMLDDVRPGAFAALASWAAELALPLSILDEATEMHEQGTDAVDVVLLDTTGDASVDVHSISTLERAFGARPLKWDTYLVLSATETRASHDLDRQTFASLALSGVAITKLDRSRGPAAALEYALESSLPVAFLSSGESLRGALHRAEPARIADLFLCGRLA